MKHKYIVAHIGKEESIFIFPCSVCHDRMWESIQAIRFGYDDNWERTIRKNGSLISAGFVSNGVCHGRSETLDIDSRGLKDTFLLVGE